MVPTYSVLISTRNRGADIERTLASLSGLTVSEDEGLELVVVDNGSSDNTPTIIERVARDRLKNLKYLRHDPPGKSGALNAGLALCTGKYIVFTDDDVRVPADWLQKLTYKLMRGEADGVVGKISIAPHLLEKMTQPPLSMLHGWFASSDYLDESNPANLIGANMAISREWVERVGGFDANVGPGSLGFFDEVLLSRQIRRLGGRLATAFDAAVVHHFDPSRLNPSSLLKLAEQQGQSFAYVFHHWEHRKSRLAPLRLLATRARLTLMRKERARAEADASLPSKSLLDALSSYGFYRSLASIKSEPPRYPAH